MSTFLGLIQEIPGISVDRFDGENLKSSAYFLSHCHWDHMIGISGSFFKDLVQYRKYLYCSPISKAILESKYSFDGSCVKEIYINCPTLIEYKLEDNESIVISVTCVSAGHCPGSIMFLFERNDTSILYTGDFRINPKDFPKFKYLHYHEIDLKLPRKFNRIYLDTTFFNPEFSILPSRQDSVLKICEVTNEWLKKDPRNVVVLECSASYGSEFLFMELSKSLNKRVHVKEHVYDSYCRIVELAQHVTNDPCRTPIHACKDKFSKVGLECQSNVPETNILTIIPSVMKWRGKDTNKIGEWDENKKRTFNVCYSTHASFDELKAFIQYFDALDIFPCVCPPQLEKEIYSLLDTITKKSDRNVHDSNKVYKFNFPVKRRLNSLPFKSQYFSDDEND